MGQLSTCHFSKGRNCAANCKCPCSMQTQRSAKCTCQCLLAYFCFMLSPATCSTKRCTCCKVQLERVVGTRLDKVCLNAADDLVQQVMKSRIELIRDISPALYISAYQGRMRAMTMPNQACKAQQRHWLVRGRHDRTGTSIMLREADAKPCGVMGLSGVCMTGRELLPCSNRLMQSPAGIWAYQGQI